MATTSPDRLQSLDTVRGVAVMGILLMNIVAFGMPEAAYFNPRAYGGAEGVDLAAYLVNFVLFDGKMRGLFSFLFGASMLLVIERAEAAGESPARVHYLRMIWLLLFGLAHLWLIWWGDILNHYAIIGMIAYFFRNLRVSRLVSLGVALVIFQWLVMASLPMMIAFLTALAANPDPKVAEAGANGLAEFAKAFGTPPPEAIAAKLAELRSDYPAILAARFAHTAWVPLNTLFFFGWETLGYMLFGMAALKSGMLAGAWERRRYVKWLAIGFGIGIPAYAAIAAWMLADGYSLFALVAGGMALTVPLRPLMIMSWACLILLAMRPGGALTARVAAAGRMAFTNYLATSLICTTIFYGYGLGWYGHLSRAELYLVVLGVWALMLLWSKPWLDRFRYGPFEWLWRTLARMQLQPMKGAAGT